MNRMGTRLAALLVLSLSDVAAGCEWKEAFFWFYCPASSSTLLGASGLDELSGPSRRYALKATCELQERGWYQSEGGSTTCDKINLAALASTLEGEGVYKKTLVVGIQVIGDSQWDRATGQVSQKLKLTGPVEAKVSMVWEGASQCPKDPFLAGSGVGCLGTVTQIALDDSGADWGKYGAAFKRRRYPVFFRAVDLAEAVAFSANKPSGQVPPPPAPKPPVTKFERSHQTPAGASILAPSPAGPSLPAKMEQDSSTLSPTVGRGTAGMTPQPEREARSASNAAARQRSTQSSSSPPTSEAPSTDAAGVAPAIAPQPPGTGRPSFAASAVLLNVEGEDLVQAGKILVAGGQVTAQPMAGFGAGWSGAGQLFWSGGSVGAVLDLLVDIPAAATYAMELYPTRAPDYGQVKIQVDGQDAPATLDGYSPRVMAPTPRQIGKFALGQGQRKISFMIVGKNRSASGYLVGIDRIRLYPVGP